MRLGQDDVRRLDWFGIKTVTAKVMALPLINPLMRVVAGNLLPAKISQRLPLSVRHVDYRLGNGKTVRLLDPLHDIVARDIHWGKGKPTAAAERYKFDCIERLSKHASTFLDIGAYAGVCGLVAARSNPELRVVAFEIVPENYLLLMRNIFENDLATRVEARLCGIGADTGTVRLPTSIGLPSHPTSMSLGSVFDHGIAINVAPLDDQVRDLRGPFLVKIDVEGFEQQVFEGGASFIAKEKPDIICEVLWDADEACAVITKMLAPLGYRWFLFSDEGMVARDRLEVEPTPRDWLLTVRSDV